MRHTTVSAADWKPNSILIRCRTRSSLFPKTHGTRSLKVNIVLVSKGNCILLWVRSGNTGPLSLRHVGAFRRFFACVGSPVDYSRKKRRRVYKIVTCAFRYRMKQLAVMSGALFKFWQSIIKWRGNKIVWKGTSLKMWDAEAVECDRSSKQLRLLLESFLVLCKRTTWRLCELFRQRKLMDLWNYSIIMTLCIKIDYERACKLQCEVARIYEYEIEVHSIDT